MTSKLFPWSKSDRRQNPESHKFGGLMPILTDPLEAKGDESKIPPRRRAKSAIARLSPSLQQGDGLEDDKAQSSSVVLQAAKSASNLLAAMDTRMRTPTMTTDQVTAIHGRFLWDDPISAIEEASPEIHELPGSLMVENHGFEADRQPSMRSAVTTGGIETEQARKASFGNAIERPKTSPIEAPKALQHQKSRSTAAVRRISDMHSSDRSASKRRRHTAELRPARKFSFDVGDTLNMSTRAMLSSYKLAPTESDTAVDTSNEDSEQSAGSGKNRSAKQSAQQETEQPIDNATLRASYENHIASITDSHSQELNSLKLYIKVLESQQTKAELVEQANDSARQKRMSAVTRSQTHTTGFRPTDLKFDSDLASSDMKTQFPTIVDHVKLSKSLKTLRAAIDVQALQSTSTPEVMVQEEEQGDRAKGSDISSINEQKRDASKHAATGSSHQARLIGGIFDDYTSLTVKHDTLVITLDSLQREVDLLRNQPAQDDLDKARRDLRIAETRNASLEAQIHSSKGSQLVPALVKGLSEQVNQVQKELEARNTIIKELDDAASLLRSQNFDLEQTVARLAKELDVPDQSLQLQLQFEQQSIIERSEHAKHLTMQQNESDAKLQASDERLIASNAKLLEVQGKLSAAEEKAKNLEGTIRPLAETIGRLEEERTRLEQNRSERERSVTTLTKERDTYDFLLRQEIRRRAKTEERPDDVLNHIPDAMRRMEVVRTHAKETSESDGPATSPTERIAQLETEIDWYLADIVLYKRDVRGYMRDLKRAEREIEKLKGAALTSGASTPSLMQTRSRATSSSTNRPTTPLPDTRSNYLTAGLGISTSGPSTPAHRPVTPAASMKSPPIPAPSPSPRRPSITDQQPRKASVPSLTSKFAQHPPRPITPPQLSPMTYSPPPKQSRSPKCDQSPPLRRRPTHLSLPHPPRTLPLLVSSSSTADKPLPVPPQVPQSASAMLSHFKTPSTVSLSAAVQRSNTLAANPTHSEDNALKQAQLYLQRQATQRSISDSVITSSASQRSMEMSPPISETVSDYTPATSIASASFSVGERERDRKEVKEKEEKEDEVEATEVTIKMG